MESLLEKPISEIKFGELDAETELRTINPRFMEMFDKLKGKDKIFWLRSYDIRNPIEEALLQLLLDKYEQVRLASTEESKVRRELAELMAKGVEIDNPQMEAEWEARLEAARQKDKEALVAEKARRAKQFGIEKDNESIPAKIITVAEDSLINLKGLGSKSVEKLNEAGIKNASEFLALSFEQKRQIIGPVVAEHFKDK